MYQEKFDKIGNYLNVEGKEKENSEMMEDYLTWKTKWAISPLSERESIGYRAGLGEKIIHFL